MVEAREELHTLGVVVMAERSHTGVGSAVGQAAAEGPLVLADQLERAGVGLHMTLGEVLFAALEVLEVAAGRTSSVGALVAVVVHHIVADLLGQVVVVVHHIVVDLVDQVVVVVLHIVVDLVGQVAEEEGKAHHNFGAWAVQKSVVVLAGQVVLAAAVGHTHSVESLVEVRRIAVDPEDQVVGEEEVRHNFGAWVVLDLVVVLAVRADLAHQEDHELPGGVLLLVDSDCSRNA